MDDHISYYILPDDGGVSSNQTFENAFSKYRDFYYYYIYPTSMFFASAQNLICSFVLAQKELRRSGSFFQYSLVNSVVSTLGTFLAAFLFLLNCGSLCPQSAHSYLSQFYKLFMVFFLVSAFYFFSSLIHVATSFNLYLKLTNKFKKLNREFSLKNVIIMGLLSTLYGFMFVRRYRIQSWSSEPQNRTEFLVQLKDESKLNHAIFISILTVCNQVILVLLVAINVLLVIEIKKIIKRKLKINPQVNLTRCSNAVWDLSKTAYERSATADEKLNNIFPFVVMQASNNRLAAVHNEKKKLERKIWILFMWISFMFCSSRLLHGLSTFVTLFMPDTIFSDVCEVVNYLWGSVVYSSYLFVYLNTNKLFKKTFFRIFLRKNID